MGKSSEKTTVLVALDKSVISRTRKIVGIFRAAAESGAIDLRIMDDGRALTPAAVTRAVREGIGGFIVGASGVKAAIARIQSLKLPLATIYQPATPSGTTSTVRTDSHAIAEAALKSLCVDNPAKSFAYARYFGAPVRWSVEREALFRALVKRHGGTCTTIVPEKILPALTKLPRPTGIFAANDTVAAEIVRSCEAVGLRVPEDVRVIGVDNDAFLCDNIRPRLSSIEPDFEQEGYKAARAIIDILRGRSSAKSISSGVLRVVIRESTVTRHPGSTLTERARAFINAHAAAGIGVSDVARELKVSSRLLSLYFRRELDTTVHEAIIERRLELLKKELAESEDTILQITERCGFGSENHPKKLFRQRFGVTMDSWRKKTQGIGS